MRHLLYLMFQYDFDVTESLKNLEKLNTAGQPRFRASNFAVTRPRFHMQNEESFTIVIQISKLHMSQILMVG